MKEVFMIKKSTYNPFNDTYRVHINSIWATAEAAEKEMEKLPRQELDPDIEVEYWIEKWQVQS